MTFAVDSPWVEFVEIWDGDAFIVLTGAGSPCGAPPPRPPRPLARPPAVHRPVLPSPGGVVRPVCEADVTCSALKVDDAADADALLEGGGGSAAAAGHGEKMAARERRLTDCTMSDSMALGFALAIASSHSAVAPSPWH